MAKKTKAAKTPKEPKLKGGPRSTTQPDVEMGRRIRLRRVELGISQNELATKLGVSFQQVQKYEKGVNRVGAQRIQQIANALEVPVMFFFDNQGGNTDKQQSEIESLIFLDSHFIVKLLRAYTKIKDHAVQRDFVALMEKVAGIGGE